MILLSFLWFEGHDSLGYWDGVAVWNSKAQKKSSARHAYFIWRTYTECHFHSFRPQNFKTQRVSSLGIQKVSTDLWLLKNVAEICCMLRNSSDSDNNLVAYVFVFFPISVSSLILLSHFLKDYLKCTTSKSKNLGHRMTKGDWLWSRENYLMCKAPSTFYFWILFWYPLQQRWSPGLSTVEPSGFEHHCADQTQ